MAPVLREEDEKNENIPKLLCQMDNHLGINQYFIFFYLYVKNWNIWMQKNAVGYCSLNTWVLFSQQSKE